jgi:hypothetical protein
MKRKVILFLALAALLLPLGASACSLGANQEAVVQQPYTVARGDLVLKVTGDGKIEAEREARLIMSM